MIKEHIKEGTAKWLDNNKGIYAVDSTAAAGLTYGLLKNGKIFMIRGHDKWTFESDQEIPEYLARCLSPKVKEEMAEILADIKSFRKDRRRIVKESEIMIRGACDVRST